MASIARDVGTARLAHGARNGQVVARGAAGGVLASPARPRAGIALTPEFNGEPTRQSDAARGFFEFSLRAAQENATPAS